MATSSTLNAWMDELSLSILTQNTIAKPNRRKLQDAFRRRVKRNIYGRTNQFEVAKRLDGLEEKFQILTLDHLSDTLHQLRIGLNEHGHQWLPDALDLLIHLSGDLARNDRLLQLYALPPKLQTPPRLKWKDILAADPIDPADLLWKVPSFKDDNDWEYEQEGSSSSIQSSPKSERKSTYESNNLRSARLRDIVKEVSYDDYTIESATQYVSTANGHQYVMSEYELVREFIHALQDLPSALLRDQADAYCLNTDLSVSTIPQSSLESMVQRVSEVRCGTRRLHEWLAEESDCTYINSMKDAAEKVVHRFNTGLNEFLERFTHTEEATIVSVIQLFDKINDLSHEVLALQPFLAKTHSDSPVEWLESLYTYANDSQVFGYPGAYHTLLKLLIPAMRTYLQSIWKWVEAGIIDDREQFFVQISTTATVRNTLWKDHFSVILTGARRPPCFLSNAVSTILLCGKTAAFLGLLSSENPQAGSLDFQDCLNLDDLRRNHMMPLDATFTDRFTEHVQRSLNRHTINLKAKFTDDCRLSQTLTSISQIYLAQGCPYLIEVEHKIFDRIDRCLDNWNDRYLVMEMLEDAWTKQEFTSIANAITVRSVYTSSRTMQNRRRSVKIMAALTFNYHIDWPIGNIIDSASMVSYQRVFLVLVQIRRAKHCLLHTGYLYALTIPLKGESTPIDQKFAQILAFRLLTFVDTIYNHLTATIISAAEKYLHKEIARAPSVDAMIDVHQQFVKRIEFSCLASPKLTVVREVLVAILDMCIRFSDLVSNSHTGNQSDVDHEDRSFRSARSRTFNPQKLEDGGKSDEDEEDTLGSMQEGYSSFILLDNNTTIVEELQELQTRFSQQLELFVAGIKGVSRKSQYAEDLEGLASQIAFDLPH